MHRAHAAMAEDADELPCADVAAKHGIAVCCGRGTGKCGAPVRGITVERLGGAGIGIQQGLHALTQGDIAGA